MTNSDKVEACLVLNSQIPDSHHQFIPFLFPFGRAGGARSTFPPARRSACRHQVLSAPAAHEGPGGSRGPQLSSERGERCTEVPSMWMVTAAASKHGSCPLRQLDQVCLDESTSLRDLPASESHEQTVHSILELLEPSGPAGQRAPALAALHLIVSAMDGEKTL